MKEMENNDFIHTLDAVYNLCSEIKERITSVETTDEEESNEGIVLLSDNLQRFQSEIAEIKSGLSSDKDARDKLRTAINLRLKEIHEVYSALSTTNERIFVGQERINEELQRIQSLKVQNNHIHVIDFKTSRPFL
jgi:septal ring factor EnvC (AmiA/AmiB activator)